VLTAPLKVVCGTDSLRRGELPAVDVPGLYVHIPFCFHKCHYCDFYSITRQSPDRMERFVDLILREAEGWTLTPTRLAPRTIFFGGGTPTLLPPPAMRRLIEGLAARLDLMAVEEFTVEANPATVDGEYAAMLRSLGVNRLSLGAQSFDPKDLKALERHHDPQDVPESLELARAAGFSRLNLDLIYAVPGQTLESWARSLDSAIALGTEHLSCYALTYEPNTPLAVRRRLGHFDAVEESTELAMMRWTRRRLAEAGLRAYEISNFARPGCECRHNLLYWDGGNYIGLGPSAASHVQGVRWKNKAHLGEWEAAVDAGGDMGLPLMEFERLDTSRRASEYVYLRLRLAEGVGLDELESRFPGSLGRLTPLAQRLSNMGVLRLDEARWTLTDRGVEVADAVASEFLTA